MADKKISALTAAATPLAGTEVLPIVQSGSTVKVSVSDLTTGRTVALRNANLTGGAAVINIGATADNTYHYLRTIDNDGQAFYVGNDDATGSFFSAGAYGRVIYSEGAKPLKVFVNGAYRAEYDTSGNYKLDTGNVVIGTAAKGIDFSANTHAAGMTSELLTWYEEGVWTPSDGSGAGLGLTVANATYTRIGRLVTANFAITYPATANATDARIGGLPFTSSSVGFSFPMVVSFSQTGICKSGLVDTSATTFLLSDTAGNALTNAQMSTLILRGTVIYEV